LGLGLAASLGLRKDPKIQDSRFKIQDSGFSPSLSLRKDPVKETISFNGIIPVIFYLTEPFKLGLGLGLGL